MLPKDFPHRRLVAVLVIGLCGAAPARSSAPPIAASAAAPPNGTYVYAVARNGTDQGTTTVALFRRGDAIETDETALIGAARAHIVGAYRVRDLGLDSYVATYQAPFPRASALGRQARFRPHAGFYDQTTVRLQIVGGGASYTIDGVPGVRSFRQPAGGKTTKLDPQVVFDAPFMTGPLFVPAFRHASGSAAIAPIAIAIDGIATDPVGGRIVRAAPRAAKTPRTDVALEYPDVATLWYDPHTFVVHEIFFVGLNLDAHLLSYAKVSSVPPFIPAPSPSPLPALPSSEVSFSSADGTPLGGMRIDPTNVKRPLPAVVMIAPPWPQPPAIDFDGNGPEPMFPMLARTFASRGYAVVRYNGRGVGKSGGSYEHLSWEQSLDDAKAAITAAREEDGVDPARLYVLGYGFGADLALAAAADPETKVAGVIALGPSVTPYRVQSERTYLARARTPDETAAARTQFEHFTQTLGKPKASGMLIVGSQSIVGNDGTWLKSAFAHDPTALAMRVKLPLFVLHPGVENPARTADDVRAYDDRLRAANPFATIVVANDLSETFGGRYDADAPLDTAAIFPYRFDVSTASAIADWVGEPKTAVPAPAGIPHSGAPAAGRPPPPPPPDSGTDKGSFPAPSHVTPVPANSVLPGQVTIPETPPPPATPSPAPVETPTPTPAPAPTAPPAPTPRPS